MSLPDLIVRHNIRCLLDEANACRTHGLLNARDSCILRAWALRHERHTARKENYAPFTEITDKHLIEFGEVGEVVMLRDKAEFLANWPAVKQSNLECFGVAY